MYLQIIIWFPIAAGVYGAAVGSYLHGKKQSPKRRTILGVVGLILVLIWAFALFNIFVK